MSQWRVLHAVFMWRCREWDFKTAVCHTPTLLDNLRWPEIGAQELAQKRCTWAALPGRRGWGDIFWEGGAPSLVFYDFVLWCDFYKKHVDAFKGRSNRVFTSVLYLYTPNEGGELVIYKPKSKVVEVSISPKAGTLVLFESERFVHEVLPAVDNRYSIAGWFRKNASISGIVDPPR